MLLHRSFWHSDLTYSYVQIPGGIILFAGKVGPAYTEEEIKHLAAEGGKRYEHGRPPGFKDKGKEKSPADHGYHLAELCAIPRQYGDLVLWMQIVKHVQSQNVKHLVFVTDDEKDDWWERVDSGGLKTIGPRPELVTEMLKVGCVESFYMYKSAQFLQYAKEYLMIEIDTASVTQANDLSQILRFQSVGTFTNHGGGNRSISAIRAVGRWLAEYHSMALGRLMAGTHSFDWIFEDERQGVVFGYDVMYLSSTSGNQLPILLRTNAEHRLRVTGPVNFPQIVLACENRQIASEVSAFLNRELDLLNALRSFTKQIIVGTVSPVSGEEDEVFTPMQMLRLIS